MITMTINGKDLCSTIGCRILEITGRASTQKDFNNLETSFQDGALTLTRKINSRKIKVRYQLIMTTESGHMYASTKLNTLLSGDRLELVFSDEPDKFFVAETAQRDGDEITFFCADPYKYALKESTASTTGNSIVIENNGLPTDIKYEITVNGDETGYIGIYSNQGAMEFGNRDERGFESAKRSETLINFNNLKNAIAGNDKFTYSKYASGAGYGIRLANKGTDYSDAEGDFVRAQFGVNVPADSSGSTTNKSYTIEASIRCNTTQYKRWCSIGLDLMTSNNESVGRIRLLDWDNGLPCGSIHLDVGGWRREWLGEYWFATNPPKGWKANPFGNEDGKRWIKINKEGGNITFQWWGGKPYTWYEPTNVNRNISKIVFFIDAPRTKDINHVYENCGFEDFKFIKNNVPYTRDVPNRFGLGTKLTIDGESGKCYVNGNYRPGEEVIGTKYFKVPNGRTEIKFLTSSWSSAQLSVKARWRERWL